GMAAKVTAARLASRAGVPVLLTSTENIAPALESASVGTCFWPEEDRLSAWKLWVLYAAESRGGLQLDDGAKQAVVDGNEYRLAAGVSQVMGDVKRGGTVGLVDSAGSMFGRGEVN